MPYLIGTDEAGYGPNLGPLVISATAWEVPEGIGGEELYALLGRAVVARPSLASRDGRLPVAMADSKLLYKPGGGLRLLERGLFSALAVLERFPNTWQEVWETLAPESLDQRNALQWYADHQGKAPVELEPESVASLGRLLAAELDGAGVRLGGIASVAIFPEWFNALVDREGTKGAVLSRATLALIRRLLDTLGDGPVAITCDKHGGRNRYRPLLEEHFPGSLIEIHGEARDRSTYRFVHEGRRLEFCFRAKAESCLPVALASMASKYLRELAMDAFCKFWTSRLPDLRPTAGYPQDARRFKAHIAATGEALGIEDRVFWRER